MRPSHRRTVARLIAMFRVDALSSLGGLLLIAAASPLFAQTATGQVSLPVNLFDLPGRNGPGVQIALVYDSDVRRAATGINRIEPTGVVGLGWRFPRERILRMTNGTGNTLDDEFFLQSGVEVNQLIPAVKNNDGTVDYRTRRALPFRIRYQSSDESWTLTNAEGIVFVYGGGLTTSGNTKQSTGSSVEWGVRWGNWIGSGKATAYIAPGSSTQTPTPQEQIAVAWNLSSVTNLWYEKTLYQYDQVLQAVATGKTFTQASYLRTIRTTDRVIQFEYLEKDPLEYADPHTAAPEPDAYQERYETRYLFSATLLTGGGTPLRSLRFEYGRIGSGALTKRLLTGIVDLNGNGRVLGPPRRFAYWGQAPADNVSVAINSDANQYNNGALYGSLKSVTLPSGAKTTYYYEPKNIPRAALLLDNVSGIDATWTDPHIYYGAGYVVVLWRKGNQYALSLYDWQGRWISLWTGNSAIMLNTTDPQSIQVTVEQDFFAVAVAGTGNSLHLFRRVPGKPGAWAHDAPSMALSNFELRSGQNFVALVDAARGQLLRYTYQETQFRAEPVVNLAGTGTTLYGLAAAKNFAAAVSSGPSQSAQSTLRLYYLDDLGQWHNGATLTLPRLFPAPSSTATRAELGLQAIRLQASDFGVTLQANNYYTTTEHDPDGPTLISAYYKFRHFVFQWSADFTKLASK